MSSWIIRRATPYDWPKIEALLVVADLPLAGVEAHLSDFFLAYRKESYDCFYRVFTCCAIVSQP